jgi:hypothetical protein
MGKTALTVEVHGKFFHKKDKPLMGSSDQVLQAAI